MVYCANLKVELKKVLLKKIFFVKNEKGFSLFNLEHKNSKIICKIRNILLMYMYVMCTVELTLIW